MRFDTIPSEMTSLPRWVCVRKDSKVPMQAAQNKAASSADPATWSDYATAKKAVESGRYDYLGFVFNGDGIVGIDIDRGYSENGFLSDLSTDCMRACESFTERSRSGRGIHIYLKGKLPFKGQNNGSGVEIYSTGRYFIVTGERVVFSELIENQSAIDYIVEKYFPDKVRESSEGRGAPIWSPVCRTQRNEDGTLRFLMEYPVIKPGMRNVSLTSYAGQLHARNLSFGQIYDELLNANKNACTPPLEADEVMSIVKSVVRYSR